jgi:hypothetical protein
MRLHELRTLRRRDNLQQLIVRQEEEPLKMLPFPLQIIVQCLLNNLEGSIVVFQVLEILSIDALFGPIAAERELFRPFHDVPPAFFRRLELGTFLL